MSDFCPLCNFQISGKDAGGPVKYKGQIYHRFCLRAMFKTEARMKKDFYTGSE